MALKNAARFKRRLKAIPPHVRKAQRTQLRANAEELAQAQARYAPRDDGDLQGSIRWAETSSADKISTQNRAGGAATTRPVRKGASPTYDYALAQELGTQKMPANPFFFPPYRAKRRNFRAALRKVAKAAIGAAVKTP